MNTRRYPARWLGKMEAMPRDKILFCVISLRERYCASGVTPVFCGTHLLHLKWAGFWVGLGLKEGNTHTHTPIVWTTSGEKQSKGFDNQEYQHLTQPIPWHITLEPSNHTIENVSRAKGYLHHRRTDIRTRIPHSLRALQQTHHPVAMGNRTSHYQDDKYADYWKSLSIIPYDKNASVHLY